MKKILLVALILGVAVVSGCASCGGDPCAEPVCDPCVTPVVTCNTGC